MSNVDKKSEEGQDPVRLCNYINVYRNERITDDMDFMAATATPQQIRRFALRVGDVLLTKDSESWDDIAVSACVETDMPDVLCGYHLALVRPTAGVAGGRFLARAVSAAGLREQFWVAAHGITRFGLDRDSISGARLPAPSLQEQEAIADFLDRETAKIDALVEQKNRLIELLQEKRTALITHAVTKGLDSDVPMKDSGIEWLGEIPEHWELLRLRRALDRVEQGWSPVAEERQAAEDEWAVIKLSAIQAGRFVPDEHKALPADVQSRPELELRAGDILMSRGNTPQLVGDVCLVRQTRPSLMLSDLVYRLVTDTRLVESRFLVYWLLSRAGRTQIEQDARGSSLSMVKLSQGHIKAWHVALPPLREQQEIADRLDRETARIDALVVKIQETIKRVKEYRTALISAAVTGKIDVRGL